MPRRRVVTVGQRIFATWYDLLDGIVAGRLEPYRRKTAGRAWGDVLEIGGGTGANPPYFAPETRLTVVEPNLHMAARLRAKAARQGRDVFVLPAIGEKLPFKDAGFDCVVTTLTLCMVQDLHLVVREAHRVLRPGGAFLFYEHVVSSNPRMRGWQRRVNPLWRFWTTGCNLDRDITAAIDSAGFRSVDVSSFDLSVGLPLTIPNIIGVARA